MPKKTRFEKVKDFTSSQNKKVIGILASANNSVRSLVGAISEKRQSAVDKKQAANANGDTPSDSDSIDNGSSHSKSSFSSDYSDSSNSFDVEKLEKNASPLPQSQNQTRKGAFKQRTQLARSLVGELVITPSRSNILIEDSSDEKNDDGTKSKMDISDDDRETRQNYVSVQRQYTISKKKKRVRASLTLIIFIINLYVQIKPSSLI